MVDRTKVSEIVGGLPTGGTDGDLLVRNTSAVGGYQWQSPTVAFNQVDSSEITNGEGLPTRFVISDAAVGGFYPFDGYFENVLAFRMRKNTEATPTITLEALAGHNLNLASPTGFSVLVNGINLGTIISKVNGIPANAAANYSLVSATAEANPINTNGTKPLDSFSLATALSGNKFDRLSSELRSYSPKDLVSVVKDFAPPLWSVSPSTSLVRSFTQSNISTIATTAISESTLQASGMTGGYIHMNKVLFGVNDGIWYYRTTFNPSKSSLPNGWTVYGQFETNPTPVSISGNLDYHKIVITVSRTIVPNIDNTILNFTNLGGGGVNNTWSIISTGTVGNLAYFVLQHNRVANNTDMRLTFMGMDLSRVPAGNRNVSLYPLYP